MSSAGVSASRSILDSVIAAILLFGAVVVLSIPIRDDDVLGHAASHLAVGLPLLLLLVARLRWPAPASPLGRRLLVGGMSIFAAGQILEAIGAFGYDGYDRVNPLASLHDVGLAATVAIPVLLCGLALLLVAHLRRPALPRWKRTLFFGAFVLLGAALLWVVFGGNA
ncbi:MAG TPA: hypothetical protein VM784_04735 [Actinomycetota bacterium]|nr:hypothetical protein [Actinomycetota bacterium]